MIKEKYWLGILILLTPFIFMSCQNEDRPKERDNEKCKVTAVLVHEDGTSETLEGDALRSPVTKYGISISGLGTYDYSSKGSILVQEETSSSKKVDYITFAYDSGLYDYRYFPRTRQEYSSRIVTPPPHSNSPSYYFPFSIKGDLYCSVYTKNKVIETLYEISATPTSLAFDAAGGRLSVEVYAYKIVKEDGVQKSKTRVSNWAAAGMPTWATSSKSGNILYVTAQKNSNSSIRRGECRLSIGGKTAVVNITQKAAKTGVDIGVE